MSIRLVRYLAQCGIASRRSAADIVKAGRVKVNGAVCTNMAQGIEESDLVFVDDNPVAAPDRSTVLLLNKPPGLVCSRSDPHNPETVYSCVPNGLRATLKPVGRLDKYTSGLLLMTDDGDLAYRLTHPRFGVEKTYRMEFSGEIPDTALENLRQGVMLDDGPTAPAEVVLLSRGEGESSIEITIHEGRNRQVRRMCEAVGFTARRLCRVQYGPIALGRLARGACRVLKEAEIEMLRRAVSPAPKRRK